MKQISIEQLSEHEQLIECCKAIELLAEDVFSHGQFLLRLKDMCNEGKSHKDLVVEIEKHLLNNRNEYNPPLQIFFKKVCPYSILHPDLSKSE
jgi:hypothetical protein